VAACPAGVITGHVANAFDSRYDRFSSGYPTAPVPNTSPDFIGSAYDLSGIGWRAGDVGGSPIFSVTMVSPRHFIGAAHVGYANGSQLNFFDPVSQTVRSYTVQTTRSPTTTFTNAQGQQQTLPSDVILGTLTAPIPVTDHVTFFPVVTGSPSAFPGQPMLNYGQNTTYGSGNQVHLGRNNVTQIALTSFNNFASEATRAARRSSLWAARRRCSAATTASATPPPTRSRATCRSIRSCPPTSISSTPSWRWTPTARTPTATR
jgi:hypothetical protein